MLYRSLSPQLKGLFFLNLSASALFSYVTIFLNLYLWNQGKQVTDVAFFNFVYYASSGTSFAIGAYVLSFATIRVVMFLSAVSATTAFVLLRFLDLPDLFLFIIVIGITLGMTHGLYYAGKNLGLSFYGRGADFENFSILSNLSSQVLSFVVPLLSALIIQKLSYSTSFLLMLTLTSTMLISSMRIPSFSTAHLLDARPLFENFTYRSVFSTSPLRYLLLSFFAGGLFRQFQSLFALVFTFSVSASPTVVGILSILYTLSSFFAYSLYQRFRRPQQHQWLLFGMVLMTIGYALAFIGITPLLVLTNIFNTMGLFYYDTLYVSQHFRLIKEQRPRKQIQLMVARELCTDSARLVMLTLILVLNINSDGLSLTRSDDFFSFVVLLIIALISGFSLPTVQRRSMRSPDTTESDLTTNK